MILEQISPDGCGLRFDTTENPAGKDDQDEDGGAAKTGRRFFGSESDRAQLRGWTYTMNDEEIQVSPHILRIPDFGICSLRGRFRLHWRTLRSKTGHRSGGRRVYLS